MAKHDFRTPSSIPIASTGRCIVVPDDAAWLGLLNAALLMLTEQWRYDQVETTDLTPEETASIWYDIYVQSLTSECNAMDCEAIIECLIDAGLIVPTSKYRIEGGIPQFSLDGGTTWTDVIGNPSAPPIAPAPQPVPGNDDDEKLCLASTRAALVIAEFYKQTYGVFTAGLANALTQLNAFLFEINQELLGIIYGEAAQLINAELIGNGFFEGHYTVPELTPQKRDALTCLLLANATIDGSSIVTFDQANVLAGVIGALGLNPGAAIATLIGYMDTDGLNHAANVEITDTGLCACAPWCADFDFTVDDGGFSVGEQFGNTFGVWGGVWNYQDKQSSPSGWSRMVIIEKTFDEDTVLTRVNIDYTLSGLLYDTTQTAFVATVGNQTLWSYESNQSPPIGNPTDLEWNGYVNVAQGDKLRILVRSSNNNTPTYGFLARIWSLHLEGDGDYPFTGYEC